MGITSSKRRNGYDTKWSNQLPEHILELVLMRLSSVDRVRFSAVCQSWKQVVARANAQKYCLPSPQLPWLVLNANLGLKRRLHLFSLGEERIYKLKLLTERGKRFQFRICIGSIDGWLIMVSGNKRSIGRVSNFFLNPLSGAEIMLPSQSTIPNCFEITSLRMVVASSAPTCSNCVLAALTIGENLAFCRPTNKTWTLINSNLDFTNIAFLEDGSGRLCAITSGYMEFVMFFDPMEALSASNNSDTYEGERFDTHPSIPVFTEPDCIRDGRVEHHLDVEFPYLVTSLGGELWLLLRVVDYSFYEKDTLNPPSNISYRSITKYFRVFRLDQKEHRWVQIKRLEDQVLFVGDRGTKSMSRVAISNANAATRTGNIIYFAFSGESDMGEFRLADGSFRYQYHPHIPDLILDCLPVWFIPNPW